MSNDYQDWWYKGVSVNFEEDNQYSKKCLKAYMEEAFRAGAEFAQRQVRLTPVSGAERRLSQAVEEAQGGMRTGHSTIQVRDVDVVEVLNRLHNERRYTSKYQWQPIETAPKGTYSEFRDDDEWVDPPRVLLSTSQGVVIAYWDYYYDGDVGGHGYCGNDSAWVGDDGELVEDNYDGVPTHWMPLPEAPEDDEK